MDADIAAPPDAAATGLTNEQARERLAHCGPNVIPPRGRRAAAVEYLLHFRNPLVLLLVASSAVLGWTGDTASMTIILAIVIASVTLDFAQERRTQRALTRLQATIVATAVALRDPRRGTIPVADTVPGDVVLLQAGDIVPADGRVVVADRLLVNEAALTGESYPVEKTAAVALAVGLTPELLPMIVSVTLARGALRLAPHHVIVKRPAAIYALGSIDIPCSDKTGTLTEAAIRVAAIDDGALALVPVYFALAQVSKQIVYRAHARWAHPRISRSSSNR